MRAQAKQRLASVAVAVALVATAVSCAEQGAGGAGGAVEIDPDDIGGVVTSAQGPEAGVWVIAETTELPTRFIRIVATDDQGRYVVPDLPDATYELFVRGYGLVDSPRVTTTPGQALDLEAVVAPDARAAAEVYPAAWWLSMLTFPEGERSPQELAQTIHGCMNCHQIGNKATREILPSIASAAASSLEAWDHRTAMGPSGPGMGAAFQRLGPQREMFADWTDRIAAGEAPTQVPPRPTGVERNIVVTLWDWGTEFDARTDSTPSDIRDATVNANGLIYGVVQPSDILAVLDPNTNTASTITVPSTAPEMGASVRPSPYWGEEDIWERRSDPRSVAMDSRGRVWLTGRARGSEQPEFCTAASNRFAQHYPLAGGRGAGGGRQVFLYDSSSEQFSEIDTCFTADHNQLSEDNVFYYGMNNAIGWLDVDLWDETHDAEASQGWCPAVLDTNGDGAITPGWTEPDDEIDPMKDHRVAFGCYSATVSPDGSIWCSGIGGSGLVRIELGSSPPETCQAEVYDAPPTDMNPPLYGSGGAHIGSDGVVWQNWRHSGYLTSFDRSKCVAGSGPATGQSCPEGWGMHRLDRNPTFGGTDFLINADESYLTHMDNFDTLGLGRDVPVYGAVNTDSLEAFVPTTQQFVTLRVPYPMGFFSRSGVGRIDDPTTGWKGKGFWSNYSNYATWHLEGGPGTLQKVVKFQIRPDPLAK